MQGRSSIALSRGRWLATFTAIAIAVVLFGPIALKLRIPFVDNDLQGLFAFVLICLLSIGFVSLSIPGIITLSFEKSDFLLAALIIWMALSSVLSADRPVAVNTIMLWMYCVIAFLLVRSLLRASNNRACFEWVMVAGGGLYAAGFVLYMTGVIEQSEAGLLNPFAQNRNYVAQFMVLPLACGIALLMNRENGGNPWLRRLLLTAVVSLLLLAILLTRSRGVWVGLTVGAGVVILWLLLQREFNVKATLRGLAVGGLGVISLALVIQQLAPIFDLPTPLDTLRTFLDLEDGSSGGRLRRWQNGWPMLLDHPWFGVGPGQWELAFHQYRHGVVGDPPGYPVPFNAWLRLAAESGLVALGALAGWLVLLIWTRLRTRRGGYVYVGALIALGVAALFHSSFSIPLLQVNFFLVAAAAAVSASDQPHAIQKDSRLVPLLLCGVLLAMLPYQFKVAAAKIGYEAIDDQLGPASRWARQRGTFRFLVNRISPGHPVAHWLDKDRAELRLPEIQLYGTGRQHNAALLLADDAAEFGNPQEAAELYKMALLRSPRDPAVYLGYCRLLLSAGALAEAERFCADGLSRSHHNVALSVAMASVYREMNKNQDARVQLQSALESLEFLTEQTPIGRVGERKRRAQLRQAADIETTLDAIDDVVPIMRDTAAIALTHKKIARYGDEVLFASNRSGRFELWRVDPDGRASLESNDEYVYFRPQVADKRDTVYFLSDRMGDGVFFLYQRNLVTGKVSLLGNQFRGTSVGDFSVSPDQNYIVYQTRFPQADFLWLTDLDSGGALAIASESALKSDPVFSPDSRSILFVRDRRELVELSIETGMARLIKRSLQPVYDPVFNPAGTQLLYVSRSGSGASQIQRVDRTTGVSEALVDSPEGLFTPLWLDPDRFLYRVKRDDAYLMREFIISQGRSFPVGPTAGVVYLPELDSLRRDLRVVHASESSPGNLLKISQDSMRDQDIQTPFADSKLSRLPMARQIVVANGLNTPVYTVWPEQDNALPGAVIWLHGSGSGLSPRWHPYAQFFARAGLVFSGVNYLSGFGTTATAEQRQAAVSNALQSLARSGRVDMRQVYLIGVSSGSVVARQFASANPSLVAGLIEYSPAGDWRDTMHAGNKTEEAGDSVRRLLFWGENDIRYHRAQIEPAMITNRLSSPTINHIVLEDEGHDIRRAASIERRLQLTMSFIRGEVETSEK